MKDDPRSEINSSYINVKWAVMMSLIMVIECCYLFGLCIFKYELITYATSLVYSAVCTTGGILVYIFLRYDRKGLTRSWMLELLRDYTIFVNAIHACLILSYLSSGYIRYVLDITRGWVFFINIYLIIAVYWLIYIISRKAMVSVHIGNALFTLYGIINHYLVRFRGSVLAWGDLLIAPSLPADLVKGYNFQPDLLMCLLVMDMLLWSILLQLGFHNIDKSRKYALEPNRNHNDGKKFHKTEPLRIIINVIMLLSIVPCLLFPSERSISKVYIPYNFVKSIRGINDNMPESYSVESASDILNASTQSFRQNVPATGEQRPNIIAIMNESFADLRVLGKFNTNKEVLPFLTSIYNVTSHGYLNVSVLGGNTAQTEYEFLSSDIISAYDGQIAYTDYFSYYDDYPGLVSVLEKLGYFTCAFHSYNDELFNRNVVYKSMGFDDILFIDDVDIDIKYVRQYASDASDYDVIKDYFTNKAPGKPAFLFNVTMQNHGGYSSSEGLARTISFVDDVDFPQAEEYLNLVHVSDSALRDLIQWFAEYDEPTIILFFGDHQPKLEEGFYEYLMGKSSVEWTLEQTMQLYKTPFFIWHNYPCESVDLGDVSPNYLAALLLKDAGLPVSNYQAYTLKQYEALPVITLNAVQDDKGNLYPRDSEEYDELISDYRILTYNHTVDKENRVEGFDLSEEYDSLN